MKQLEYDSVRYSVAEPHKEMLMLTIENHLTTCVGFASQLFELLNQHGIVYCHWKSNELLAEGLRGETDLDILVDRASFTPTIAILLNMGFKQAEVRWGPSTPGVLHFYAYDPHASDLIHVHLYSHLMTGESLVKTHVIPCDSVLLEKCDRIGNVQVPAKEAEAALFVLRSFIKSGSLLHMMLHGQGRGPDEPDEFWFADEGIQPETAYKVLQEHYGAVDERLFQKCYQALTENQSAIKKWQLGRRIRRCLRGCARYTYGELLAAYASLVMVKIKRKARGNIKNKVLNSGGAVVAFIGGDATGKSTLVGETSKWLGSTFAVSIAHVGKPRSTWITAPLRILLPLARQLFPGQRHQAQQAAEVSKQAKPRVKQTNRSPSLLYALRAFSLAWDRAHLLRKVHRRAAMGEIVICDRYPTDEAGGTDGPRLRVRERKQSWLINFLARCEHRLYAQNAPPDVALQLHISIEVAKQRNHLRKKADKHSDEDLEIRHQMVRTWKKTGTKVVRDIDTDVSLELTVKSVKEAIWESL